MIDIELLISEVQQYPSLWDISGKTYNDREQKKKDWNEVASKVIENWEIFNEKQKTLNVDEIKKKWKNIKDYYKKEKKDLPSGSAVSKKKKCVYFDMLGFLDKTIEPRDTLSNISSSFIKENFAAVCAETNSDADDNSLIDINTVSPEKSSFNNKRQFAKKGKKKMTDFQQNVLELLNSRKDVSEHNEHLMDEDKLFLLSFLPTLKTMTTIQKYDFKIKMMQVLKDINTQHLPPFIPLTISNHNTTSYTPAENYHNQLNPTNFNSYSSYESNPLMSPDKSNNSSILNFATPNNFS